MNSRVGLEAVTHHTNEIIGIVQNLDDAEEANRFCELYLKILVAEIRAEVVEVDKRIEQQARISKQDEDEFIKLHNRFPIYKGRDV